jgi:hypothetical protein
MAHKLSDGLATLSLKAKSVEDKIAQAKTESKAKLDARIAEAKSYAEKIKSEFISKADAVKANADAKISSAKNSIQEKVAQLKAQASSTKAEIEAKVATKKQEVTLKNAERDYNDAVDYAQNCIDWATIALADVEEASLEVLEAKAKLDDLKAPGV